jgi:hypothetical protein
VGYKSTGIIFMGWTRYSCKFHLLIHANKFSFWPVVIIWK